MGLSYAEKVRAEFGDIDDEKWHDDSRIRVVWCSCPLRHHAHVTKEEYAKLLNEGHTIVFDCGKADL